LLYGATHWIESSGGTFFTVGSLIQDLTDSQDKQLRGISPDDVLKKRRLDQALNAKEFAVLAGISYSMARDWFRSPGFPVVPIGTRPVVFWSDFEKWRAKRMNEYILPAIPDEVKNAASRPASRFLSPRAAQILSEG
jgi:hypothetical protein